jgi:hypothetical protein
MHLRVFIVLFTAALCLSSLSSRAGGLVVPSPGLGLDMDLSTVHPDDVRRVLLPVLLLPVLELIYPLSVVEYADLFMDPGTALAVAREKLVADFYTAPSWTDHVLASLLVLLGHLLWIPLLHGTPTLNQSWGSALCEGMCLQNGSTACWMRASLVLALVVYVEPCYAAFLYNYSSFVKYLVPVTSPLIQFAVFRVFSLGLRKVISVLRGAFGAVSQSDSVSLEDHRLPFLPNAPSGNRSKDTWSIFLGSKENRASDEALTGLAGDLPTSSTAVHDDHGKDPLVQLNQNSRTRTEESTPVSNGTFLFVPLGSPLFLAGASFSAAVICFILG